MSVETRTPAEELIARVSSDYEGRARFRVWLRRRGWRHAVCVLAALFALFPVAWIVSASFNAVNTLSAGRIIPTELTLDNFKELFNSPITPVDTWLWNSVKIALVAASVNVLVAAFAAYAFSRLRFRGRRALLTSLLVFQIFPQFLGFIAFFSLARQVGAVVPPLGLNTHAFLILVYLGGAAGFNAFLLKGYLDSIPTTLDEAALIDGAGEFGIFWRIIMPLARPMLAVIFILSFVAIFNEYILASFLLSGTDQFTLPVGLQAFLAEGYNAKWGVLAATALLGALPIVIVFLVVQKQIIGALTEGAIKG